MLKVDLRKAFDSIRWDFILSTLRAIHFREVFVKWIEECITTPTFSITVNGASGGYFKSRQGLRQSDPLSPYLFVLAMEVFSSLLASRFDLGYIAYHPNTSELQLSHLMFADDVMIFFDGGAASLHAISETLDDFAGWSGLNVNRYKSELFLAGLTPQETEETARYEYPIGTLPTRYLGLPLMHRKLRISEYDPLLNKLAGTFRAWAVKMLSYAGRLHLLSSVINGTVIFWMSAFILPKGCVKKLESIYWHKHHHLRNISFWAVESKTADSASWKSILSLRPLAEQFLKCKVNNGANAYFWYDNWTLLGSLINFLGPTGPRDLRLPISASVRQASNPTGWRLPHPRSDNALALHAHLTTVIAPHQQTQFDSFHWIVDNKDCKGFSSSKTWEAIRPRLAKELGNPACSLCNSHDESRDHLFLICSYANSLWQMVFSRLGPQRRLFVTWNELLSWTRLSTSSAPSTLRKVATHSLIYNVWRQRNEAVHRGGFATLQTTFKTIDRDIRNTITA
ncbi:uncharacterized protein LOC106417565 [Brassica napus]|uniref:uncharacterized protein LOC106417565 n=1 Tax=Brassica napus TaxID=3708 RepID=UPI0006AAB685|nr:uncharacterized protein LOC106417565 [Brassica napus]